MSYSIAIGDCPPQRQWGVETSWQMGVRVPQGGTDKGLSSDESSSVEPAGWQGMSPGRTRRTLGRQEGFLQEEGLGMNFEGC